MEEASLGLVRHLIFLLNLTASEYFSDLANLIAGVSTRVPFLVVGLSRGLLCVDMLFFAISTL